MLTSFYGFPFFLKCLQLVVLGKLLCFLIYFGLEFADTRRLGVLSIIGAFE